MIFIWGVHDGAGNWALQGSAGSFRGVCRLEYP